MHLLSIPREWLASGTPAVIAGLTLRPLTDPPANLAGEPSCRHESITWVQGENGQRWVLKCFPATARSGREYAAAVAGCLPRLPPFRGGWERRVLGPNDLDRTSGLYVADTLAAWLDGAVLMPRIGGAPWRDVCSMLAGGRLTLSGGDRLKLAGRLAEAMLHLELAEVSHRDLSSTNLLVHTGSMTVSLVDWDALFHPTLDDEAVIASTPGYGAPWLKGRAQRSWVPGADRYALAIVIAEILSVTRGTAVTADGSLFRQEEVGQAGARFADVHQRLAEIGEPLADLYAAAWSARRFADCPSPADWFGVLGAGDPAAEASSATYRSWSGALTREIAALRDGHQPTVDRLIADLPGLGTLITPAQRGWFAHTSNHARAIRVLEPAITGGDDAAIASVADLVDRRRIHPGDRVRIDGAVARHTALAALAAAVSNAAEDRQIVDAWWRAGELGVAVPPDLAVVARAAFRRVRAPAPPKPAAAVTSTAPAAATPELIPADESSAQPDRAGLLAALATACTSGSPQLIAGAARALRAARIELPEALWATVGDAEATLAAEADFRAAVSARDARQTALAWAHLTALWPGTLDPADDAMGQRAYREWGRALRRRDAGEDSQS